MWTPAGRRHRDHEDKRWPGWAVDATGLENSAGRALLANPVLATLSERLRGAVAKTLTKRTLRAGESLWGGEPDCFVVCGVGARLRVHPEEPYPTLTVYRYQGAVLAPWLWKPSLWPASKLPRLDAIADVDSEVFVADLSSLQALATDHSDWGGRSFDDFLRLLFTEQILAIAPDMNSLSAPHRLELAKMFRQPARKVRKGEVVFDWTMEPPSLYAAMYGSRFSIVVRKPGSTEARPPIVVTGGQILGIGALSRWYWEVKATAVSECEVLEIPRPDLQLKLQLDPQGWLARLSAGIGAMSDSLPSTFDALQRHPLFEHVPPEVLFAVVRGSTLADWAVGTHPPSPFGSVPGVGVLLDGEVAALLQDFDESPKDVMTLGRHSPVGMIHKATLGHAKVFGLTHELIDYVQADAPFKDIPHVRWRARRPPLALFIPRQQLVAQLKHGGDTAKTKLKEAEQLLRERFDGADEFRRVLGANHGPAPAEGLRRGRRTMDVLVSFPTRDPKSEAAVDAMLLQGLERIHADFGEPGVLLRIRRDGAGSDPKVVYRKDGQLLVIEWVLPPDTKPRQVAQLLVDKIGPGGPWALTPEGERAPRAVVIVRLPPAEDTLSGVTFRGEMLQAADTIVPFSDAPEWPLPLDLPSEVPLQYVAAIPRSGAKVAPPAAAVRVNLDAAAVGSWTLADGPPTGAARVIDEACTGRLARGLTHRRVGVALGGGGAWGMAHVALLQGLTMHGVPVDLISGASVGSTVGAYFAAKGRQGLYQLVGSRKALRRAMWAGVLTLRFFEDRVNQDLDHMRVENLVLPFFPMSTDVLVSSSTPVLEGSLGEAVRKSGSFPPFYSPTQTSRGSFVDGGFSANLPVNSLRTEGARLLIASNIVPPPPLQLPDHDKSRLAKLRRAAAELSPLHRGVATVRALITLFESGGAQAAADAPVYFDEGWTGTMPWQLSLGPEIIESTLAQSQFWEMLQGARARWEYLKEPRRGAGTERP